MLMVEDLQFCIVPTQQRPTSQSEQFWLYPVQTTEN
jgi:hypothetical protein